MNTTFKRSQEIGSTRDVREISDKAGKLQMVLCVDERRVPTASGFSGTLDIGAFAANLVSSWARERS